MAWPPYTLDCLEYQQWYFVPSAAWKSHHVSLPKKKRQQTATVFHSLSRLPAATSWVHWLSANAVTSPDVSQPALRNRPMERIIRVWSSRWWFHLGIDKGGTLGEAPFEKLSLPLGEAGPVALFEPIALLDLLSILCHTLGGNLWRDVPYVRPGVWSRACDQRTFSSVHRPSLEISLIRPRPVNVEAPAHHRDKEQKPSLKNGNKIYGRAVLVVNISQKPPAAAGIALRCMCRVQLV